MKRKIISLCFFCFTTIFMVSGCATLAENSKGEEKPENSGKVQEIYTGIKEAYGDSYVPDTEYEEAKAEKTFGIDMDNVEDFFVEVSENSEDILIIIEAEDGKIDEAVEDLENYKEGLVKDNMDNLRINAATVYEKDSYAIFVILGENGNDGDDENARLKFFKVENQKAVDALDMVFEEK